MNFLETIEKFAPLLASLLPADGDENQTIDPEVVADLEETLNRLEATLGRVRAIRDLRVDTSTMSIADLDKLVREQAE